MTTPTRTIVPSDHDTVARDIPLIELDVWVDRQHGTWISTSRTHPGFCCEAQTIDDLHAKFPEALCRAGLPIDADLKVQYHYDGATRLASSRVLSPPGPRRLNGLPVIPAHVPTRAEPRAELVPILPKSGWVK